MKSKIRSKLVALFLAAVTTACFVTACGNSDDKTPDVTNSVFGNDEINNAISTTTSDTDETPTISMKFKEWYDSQDASDVAGDRKDTGGSILNNMFIVYENAEHPDGFIVSGRTIVPLADNEIPSDTHGLRLESTGQRINFLAADKLASLDSTLAEFEAVIDNASKTQLSTIEDRMNLAEDEDDAPANDTPVFFNNYKTNLVYNEGVDMVALFSEFKDYATVLTSAESFSFDIHTAAGTRTIMFTLKSADEFEVSYGDEENSTAVVTAKSTPATSLFLTKDDIEDIFGYQVEIYDGTINIVTDNKDLFTELTTLPASSLAEPAVKPEGPTMDEIDADENDVVIVTTDSPEPPDVPADTAPSDASGTNSSTNEVADAEPAFLDVSYSMYCTGTAVNIRSSYSTSSTSLGKLTKGDKVEVDGFGYANGNEWYRIKYDGKTAYVVTMYFSSTKPATPYDSAPSSGNNGSSGNASSSSSRDYACTGKYTQPDGSVIDIKIDENGDLFYGEGHLNGPFKFVDGKLYYYNFLYNEWEEVTYTIPSSAGGAITHDNSDINQTDESNSHHGEM